MRAWFISSRPAQSNTVDTVAADAVGACYSNNDGDYTGRPAAPARPTPSPCSRAETGSHDDARIASAIHSWPYVVVGHGPVIGISRFHLVWWLRYSGAPADDPVNLLVVAASLDGQEIADSRMASSRSSSKSVMSPTHRCANSVPCCVHSRA